MTKRNTPQMTFNGRRLPENLELGIMPHIRDLANSGAFDSKLEVDKTTLVPCPVGCCKGRKLRVHKMGDRICVSLYDISSQRLLLRFHPSVVDVTADPKSEGPKPRGKQ